MQENAFMHDKIKLWVGLGVLQCAYFNFFIVKNCHLKFTFQGTNEDKS